VINSGWRDLASGWVLVESEVMNMVPAKTRQVIMWIIVAAVAIVAIILIVLLMSTGGGTGDGGTGGVY
jgi:hypothetical protein